MCGVEACELFSDLLGDLLHGFEVVPEVLVKLVCVGVVAAVFVVFAAAVVLDQMGVFGIGELAADLDRVHDLLGGVVLACEVFEEQVVACAVDDDQGCVLRLEAVGAGGFVGVGVGAGGGNQRGNLDVVAADLLGDVCVDVGGGDDLHLAVVGASRGGRTGGGLVLGCAACQQQGGCGE